MTAGAAPAPFAPGQPGALEGLRVVDLTQMLAGPFCTMMLADQGADVIKVEPMDGDHTRTVGPFHKDDAVRHYGGYFASVNRNKRSIALDLKKPEGRELLAKLADGADVVVENYRAGVMERLGLSYETLKARNPKLVYATIRGFGDPRIGNSPYVQWPAYDVVAQAMGGIMQITGANEPPTPIKVGPGVGDIVPAMACAFGIVSAVFRAGRTGQGQFVDVSMVDTILSLCERIVHQHAFEQAIPGPEGHRHPILAPFGMFPAKDGWITIAAHTDEWWAKLCPLIGREDLIADPRTSTLENRRAHRNVVYDAVDGFTRARTKAELMGIFGGKLPFGPVYHVREIVDDPHFKAREMVVEVDHPGLNHKPVVAGVPVKMSETPGRIRRRAPLLGEDTDTILAEAGLSASEIARIRAANVVA